MRRLRPRDLHNLLGCLRESYAVRDLDALPHHTVRILRQVVPAEWAWYDAADPIKGRTTWVVEPFDTFPGAQRVFSQHMHEHPCFLHRNQISDGRCWRLSDFLSRRRLHRLNLYNEYYRRRGIEYQLGLRLTASTRSVTAVGVNRSSRQEDFSDDNVLCMSLLGPHLVEAYRNAEALTDLRRELEHAGRVEDVDRGVVMLRKAGVQFVSPLARKLIEKYIGWPRGRAHVLPDVLSAWMTRQERQLARDDTIPAPRRALVLRRGDQQLRVRLLTHPEQNL